MAHWDEDSPRLRQNLTRVPASARDNANRRVKPTATLAKRWQRETLAGLKVPDRRYVGRFRGEAGLEDVGVSVGGVPGVQPSEVASALRTFESTLQATAAALDAQYPARQNLDGDGLRAVIDLAAWTHAEWVRIHPFANGNGRTARLWANFILMRYGIAPCVRLRPRPDGGYRTAGAAAMKGDWRPTATVFGQMLHDSMSGGP